MRRDARPIVFSVGHPQAPAKGPSPLRTPWECKEPRLLYDFIAWVGAMQQVLSNHVQMQKEALTC